MFKGKGFHGDQNQNRSSILILVIQRLNGVVLKMIQNRSHVSQLPLFALLLKCYWKIISNSLSVLYPLTKAQGYKTHNSLDKNHFQPKTMGDPIYIIKCKLKFKYLFKTIIQILDASYNLPQSNFLFGLYYDLLNGYTCISIIEVFNKIHKIKRISIYFKFNCCTKCPSKSRQQKQNLSNNFLFIHVPLYKIIT